jgi:hypothetical protein
VASGRTGANALSFRRGAGGSYQSMWKTIAAGSGTIFWGGYYTVNSLETNNNSCMIVGWGETSSSVHVFLRFDGITAGGTFSFRNNSNTLLGSVSSGHTAFANGDAAYLECKVVVHDSTGSVELKINGVVVITASGLDTRNAGTGIPSILHFGQLLAQASSTGGLIDDTYYLDNQGSAPHNTYLGDVRVETLRPSGAGNSTQFIPSAGANFENVDELVVDGDTTYNSETTVSDKDTFAMGNLPEAIDAIFATMQLTYWRKDNAGPRSGRQVIRSGGTDYEGSTVIMLDAYKFDEQIRIVDPATTVAWTESGVNAIEAGYKVQA